MKQLDRFLLVILIIFIILFGNVTNLARARAETGFIDNFNKGSIDTTWGIEVDQGVNVVESDGMLRGVVNTLNSLWKTAYIYKSINGVSSIDLDYSFDFKDGMGRIYLIGTDNTNNIIRWIVGLSDGWDASNARPLIYRYDSNGKYDQSKSWNTQDLTSNKITTTGGSGHIRVTFINETEIQVDFTFPQMINSQSSEIFTMNVLPTSFVQLFFGFPPSNYYDSGENWHYDNYAENLQLSPETTTRPSSTQLVNQASSLIPDTVSALVMIVSIAVIGGVIVIFLNYYQNKQKKNLNIDNINEQVPNQTIRKPNIESMYSKQIPNNFSKVNICYNCKNPTLPGDIFCHNCGSRL